MNQIVTTSDGSHTIFVPELNEHYHSTHGAIQESEYIFIREGLDYCIKDQVRVFEAGFGTGLNAFLTALRCSLSGRIVSYTAIEKYPLDIQVIKMLNYPAFTGHGSEDLFSLIHSAEWENPIPVSGSFNLKKIKGDLVTDAIGGPYDLIYFDAFGPDKQPEMWTRDVFQKISDSTAPGGVLVTYSAKGDVRRNLQYCGFEVSLLAGPPGKRHIIRAVKF